MTYRIYACASRSNGIWGIAIGPAYLALKAPWRRPLWSERNRKQVRVLPLGRGWRINLRWDGGPSA